MKKYILPTLGMLLCLSTSQAATVTQAQWLQKQTKPIFKSGHTLQLLGQATGLNIPVDARAELASNWGYAVRLSRPTGEGQLITLCNSLPAKYKPAAMIGNLLNDMQSFAAGSYLKDANGNDVVINGRKIMSTQISDAAFTQNIINKALGQISGQISGLTAPLMQVENWTEYMPTVTEVQQYGANDAAVQTAKGTLSWSEYVTLRLNHYDSLMRVSIKSRYPQAFYTSYTYETAPLITDLPGSECYFNYFNSGYNTSSSTNILSKLVGQRGAQIASGNPFFYPWISSGFERNITDYQGDATQPKYSDMVRYTGYLKMAYTLGMLGADAYFYPDNNGPFEETTPPTHLTQIAALGQVHALFSWLEPILRNSDLVLGPENKYEFPTGYGFKKRVVVRKLKNADRWLVSAWAMDSVDQDVTVTIPVLGDYTINARACGTVCLVGKIGTIPTTLWYDENGMNPSITASTRDTTQSESNPNIVLIARPSFSTPGGIYGTAQSITLSCATQGAVVRYSTNGTDPTEASPVAPAAGITVTGNATIKARAFKTNLKPSQIVTGNYRILASAPTNMNFTNGVTYKYYEGNWTSLPNFNTMTPQSTGMCDNISLNLVPHRAESFAVEFSGYIDVPTDGYYTFSSMSDDGSNLVFSNYLMVDNDGIRTAMTRKYGERVWIKSGKYPITVAYFFRDGLLSYLLAEWDGPGLPFGRIPQQYLFRSNGVIGVVPLSGKAPVTVHMPQISLAKQAAGYVLTVSTQENHTVELYSGSGRLLQKMYGKNLVHYTLGTYKLAQGIYVVRMHTGAKTFSRTIVIE